VGRAQEGEEDPAAGAPGATERGVLATRAVRTLSSGDPRKFVVVGGGGRGERWGRAPPERWNPPPTSPRAAEAAEEQVPAAGAEMPATGRLVEKAARTAEAPAGAVGASVSAAVAVTGTAAAAPEPSRKRKRGFSSLR
jgi:hypothetical protein